MIHMIQNAKDQVLALTNTAYQTAAAQGKLPGDVQVRANVEIPKDPANGDYTTTFALAAAKAMKRSPREIAAVLADLIALFAGLLIEAARARRHLTEQQKIDLYNL